MNNTALVTSNVIKQAITRIKAQAVQMREDAGLSGSWNDGGASRLLEKLEIFTTVWDGNDILLIRIPAFMKPVVEQVLRESDVDYDEYIRLKQKFEK